MRRDGGGGGEPGRGLGGVSPLLPGNGASASFTRPSSPFASALPPPPPCRVQSGVPRGGVRCWGDACSSPPPPEPGRPRPRRGRCRPRFLLPFSAQPRAAVLLRLTDRSAAWLSPFFTAPEVGTQQKVPSETRDLRFVLLHFTLFLLFWS